MLYFKPDLHVGLIGDTLMWIGGISIYTDESMSNQMPSRFIFDPLTYRFHDTVLDKDINEMSQEEIADFTNRLMIEVLNKPENQRLIADYEDAISKGLYM